MRKILLLVLLAAGVAAFFVYHHPPMRLMPPPLLFQAGGERALRHRPRDREDSRIEVFYATSRLPVGPRDNRILTVAPDWRLHLGTGDAADRRRGHDPRPDPRMDRPGRAADRPFIHLERMAEAGDPPAATTIRPSRAGSPQIDAALAASRSRTS